MKKNIGFIDRIVRFVMIDFLIGIAYLGNETIEKYSTLAFIIGIILIFNIISGYSPLYHLMGLNTLEPKGEDKDQVSEM